VRTLLEVLSAEERAEIHERSLRVLADTGVRVDTAPGRRLLAEAGAQVDEASRLVRVPPALVEECLRLAPRRFSLGARRPGWSVAMNAGDATLVMSGEATQVVDAETGRLRPGTHADWLEATRLIEAVDEIGVYWATVDGGGTAAGSGAAGGPLASWVRYNVDLQRAFSKHIQDSWLDPSWSPWLLEVLGIVFGGRDEIRRRRPYSFLVTPVSPLVIEEACTDSWLALRGWGIPLAALPMPMMGSTSPGSLMGTVLLANCEMLAMLCLAQAAEPGTPFIAAALPVAMDPRSGRYTSNTFHPVLSAACTEMARHYGLPVMGSGSGTDAFVPGMQAGYEKAVSSLVGTLAGPDLLVGPGSLGGAMVFDRDQVLIDVEIFRMCSFARQGVTVRDDLWLDDVIASAGPGGQYIGERSTRANVRGGEWYSPGLGVRETMEAWEAAGRPSVGDQARRRAEELLAGPPAPPLADDAERELRELVERAVKEDAAPAGRRARHILKS
jgi:trimethylamine---corrinoid protein Co-methyltransferase